MPRTALRLLLAFCLVLNGIGNAMAAAAMPALMGQEATAVDVGSLAGDACAHAEGEARASATGASEHAAPAIPHPAGCEEGGCNQSDCSCPCVQLVQAALLDLGVISAPLGHSRLVAAFPTGHSTPALLHPIRPPIA